METTETGFIGPISWNEIACECENLCKYEHICILCDYLFLECRILCVDPQKVDCPIKEAEDAWKEKKLWGLQCKVCTVCCRQYSITGPRKLNSERCASCFHVLEKDQVIIVETELNPKVFQFDGFFHDPERSVPRHCIVCIECCKKYVLVYEEKRNNVMKDRKLQR